MTAMTIDLRPSWINEELEMIRDTAVRFVESEMLPDDEAARKRGHVGHELWRKAREVGLLYMDILAEYGGGTSGTTR
jgi:acyl-CoA dehydrogenase